MLPFFSPSLVHSVEQGEVQDLPLEGMTLEVSRSPVWLTLSIKYILNQRYRQVCFRENREKGILNSQSDEPSLLLVFSSSGLRVLFFFLTW